MKLKKQSWKDLDRSDKAASILFPHLTPQERQAEMSSIAKTEGKRAPYRADLIPDAKRGCVSPLGNLAVGWPQSSRGKQEEN
jgi:hypothetical protein